MRATHSAVNNNGKTYHFNLEYQVEQHLRMHLLQWPKTDPTKEQRRIRSFLLRGQCWYWPEPEQFELFGGGA